MQILITVSDPWEFGEVTKWQPIRGNLLEIAGNESEARALIELDQALSFGGSLWHFVIAAPRHHGDEISTLRSGKKISATFIGVSNEQVESDAAFDTRGWRGGLAFIGDVELRDPNRGEDN